MPEIIYHIGLHKTGTTTLQERIFPACDELNDLCTLNEDFERFYRYAGFTDPMYFSPNEARQLIAPALVDDRPNLLSNEAFSGPMFAAVAEFGLDHRSAILANLAATFPDARLFITLRRQDGLAKSLYRQYLKSGGTRQVDRFYGFAKTIHQPLMSRNRFHFRPYVDRLMELFPGQVKVMVFEQMCRTPKAYLDELSAFLGVPLPPMPQRKENATRLGPGGLKVARVLNHLFRSHLNPAGLIPGVPVRRQGQLKLVSPMTLLHDHWPFPPSTSATGPVDGIAARILDECRDENRALDEAYDLGLQQYGYY